MNTVTDKISKKQNAVIYCLQNGWILVTDSQAKGANVCSSQGEFHIDNGVFNRLLQKCLIAQSLSYPFNYDLTFLGKDHKCTPVNIEHL